MSKTDGEVYSRELGIGRITTEMSLFEIIPIKRERWKIKAGAGAQLQVHTFHCDVFKVGKPHVLSLCFAATN